MMQKRFDIFAAVILILGLSIISGCCMKRDLIIIDDKINNIRANQQGNVDAINRLDSLLTEDTEAAVKLRAEIRSAVNELIEQFRIMQANMNDLNERVISLVERRQPPDFAPPIRDINSVADTTGLSTLPGVNCQDLYDDSFTFVVQGKYDDAIASFADFLKYCGSHSIADDARYWIGESYYSMDNFNNAISEFDLLISEFPTSEKLPMTYYKLARSHEELGQKKDAIEYFKKIIDDFPDTFEAEQAGDKLKELE